MSIMIKSAFALVLSASFAVAACPGKPPVSIRVQSGDQTVTAAWLDKTLSGLKVIYGNGGTETYGSDGSYSFRIGSDVYSAPSYRFYNDGTRCIAYQNRPRYDRYVVRDGKLLLINSNGDRFPGKLAK